MQDETGAPVATYFGASEIQGKYHGHQYVIKEETSYPFDGKITFRCQFQDCKALPFAWRVPQWCTGLVAKLNGKAIPLPENCAGCFMETVLSNGDILELALPLTITHRSDRQWGWFERGPLVYSLKIANECILDDGTDRFSPRTMTPTAPWSYAVAPEATAKVITNPNAGDYPYDAPPEFLEITAKCVRGAFAELDQRRYTPKIPLFCSTDDMSSQTLHLVMRYIL